MNATDHHALVDALQRRGLDGPGKTDAALRQAMAERAAGGPARVRSGRPPLG